MIINKIRTRILTTLLILAIVISMAPVMNMGAYAGSVPAKTSISSLESSTTSIKVTWKSSKNATGYQIRYGTHKPLTKSYKTATVKSGRTTSRTINSLKKNTRYYFKVRAYAGKTGNHSSWSKVMSAMTTKNASTNSDLGNDSKVSITSTISEDTKFHSANVWLTEDEMEAAGFALGDSCDIAFGGGFTLEDVPYYNGYYAKYGSPVIVAYPGSSNIIINYNIVGIWDKAGLTEGESVTITLKEKGRYKDIQDVIGQVYSFDRSDYDSDETYCNFREVKGGNLKADTFYRGASPVDNSRGRAAYTDNLLLRAGVNYVVDLADSDDDMASYMAKDGFDSPFSAYLYKHGRVLTLDMGSSYESEEYSRKVVQGFEGMLGSDGPYYIHCMEGKDRTGFVCLILEALAGANTEELMNDYMKTYENYYSVYKDRDPAKYDAIRELYFDAFTSFLDELTYLTGENYDSVTQNASLKFKSSSELFANYGDSMSEELRTATYVKSAENYLSNGGMSDGDIQKFKKLITEGN